MNGKITASESEISTLKNTTIPNLDNKYLVKNSVNGDSMLG